MYCGRCKGGMLGQKHMALQLCCLYPPCGEYLRMFLIDFYSSQDKEILFSTFCDTVLSYSNSFLNCILISRYQSADVGNFLSLSLLESQYHYQTSIEESVVVIYDTKKSARGFLTLKAYRLTPQVGTLLTVCVLSLQIVKS